MKKILTSILAASMVLCLCACSTEGTKEEKKPKKVDAQFITGFTITKDTYGDESTTDYVVEYDGNAPVRITGYVDDQLVLEQTFDGSIDKPLTEVRYDSDGDKTYEASCRYDDKGRLLETKSEYENGGTYRHTYEYDKKGNIIDEAYYEDEYQGSRTTREYDTKGNMILEIRYSDGEESLRWSFEYDDDGNEIAGKCTEDGEEIESFTAEYDKKSDRTRYIETDEYGDTTEWTYERTYDADDRIIEFNSYRNGTHIVHETTEYDHRGNILEHLYDREGEEDRHIYEYDEDGDLILKVSYENDIECYRYEYAYNANGDLISEKFTNSYGRETEQTYEYGEDGYLTKYTEQSTYSDVEVVLEYETHSVTKTERAKLVALREHILEQLT